MIRFAWLKPRPKGKDGRKQRIWRKGGAEAEGLICLLSWFSFCRLLGTLVISLQQLVMSGRLNIREALVDKNHSITRVSHLIGNISNASDMTQASQISLLRRRTRPQKHFTVFLLLNISAVITIIHRQLQFLATLGKPPPPAPQASCCMKYIFQYISPVLWSFLSPCWSLARQNLPGLEGKKRTLNHKGPYRRYPARRKEWPKLFVQKGAYTFWTKNPPTIWEFNSLVLSFIFLL